MPLLTSFGSARSLGFGATVAGEDLVFIDEIDVTTPSTTLTFTNLPTNYTHFYVSGIIAYSNTSESVIYGNNQLGVDDGSFTYGGQSLALHIYNTSKALSYADDNHYRMVGNNGSTNLGVTSYKAYIQFANDGASYTGILWDYGGLTGSGNSFKGMGSRRPTSNSGVATDIKFYTGSSSQFCSPTRLSLYGLK